MQAERISKEYEESKEQIRKIKEKLDMEKENHFSEMQTIERER